jgi:hypothetical protein
LPLVPISIAVVVVLVLLIIGFIAISKGSPKKSVKANSSAGKVSTTAAPPTLAPVTTTDLDTASKTIDANLAKQNDTKDYPAADLSDSSLGL